MINNDLTNSCLFDYPDTSDLGNMSANPQVRLAQLKNELAKAQMENDTARAAQLQTTINTFLNAGVGLVSKRQDVKIAASQAKTAEAQARMAAGMTPSSSFNIKNLALPLLGLAAVGLVVFVAKKRS